MTSRRPASPVWQVSASSQPEALGDWLELRALFRGSTSMQELVSLFRSSGTIEQAVDVDDRFDSGSRTAQEIAQTGLAAVAQRAAVCGPAYPFEVTAQSLTVRRGWRQSSYTFMSLLSAFGKDGAGNGVDGARLFEHVSGEALGHYLGHSATSATVFQFGSPRSTTPRGFAAAVDELCRQLGEGGGSKERPSRQAMKDARLDVVAWIPVPDARHGKLVAFGQCATGWNWQSKLSELQVRAWCDHWTLEPLIIDPVKVFFMPHTARGDWGYHTRLGGMVFDRARIALFSRSLSRPLRDRLTAWNTATLSRERGP